MKNFYVLLIVLLINNAVNAQWQQTNGPYSGTIRCIAINGSNTFAGTTGGIYLSTDNGGSWTPVNNGLSCLDVKALAISGNNIFAGTIGGGMFLSTDNGSNWKAVNNGLPGINNHILSLTISGDNIFAGTVRDGVFLSTDNGSSWTAINSGITNKTIWSLASSGSNIFAGTETAGVFLSTNNGNSWTAISTGLPSNALNVQTLLIDGNNIFAGGSNGIYTSTNNGSNWTSLSSGLSGFGIYINSIVKSGNNIFAGTNGGVYLSTNNGASWSVRNTGFVYAATVVFSIAINGSNILSGTENSGMFVSTNNADNWVVTNTGIIQSYIPALAISDSTIFAANPGNGTFRSSNNGNSWAASNNGLTNLDVAAFAISGKYIFEGAGCGGVFLSTDNGSNWAAVNTGLTSPCIFSFAVSGSNIFAGTQGGVFLTTNNGNNWEPVNNGLPSNTWGMQLAIIGNNIFAGIGYDVYLSTNNGSSWTRANTGLNNNLISALATNGDHIFAGTSTDGVYLSANNGSSWTRANTGLSSLQIYSFARSGSNMYVGTGAGVFKSVNNGSSWTALNSGLNSLVVRSLVIGGGYLYAGTMAGVWKMLLTEDPKFTVSGKVADQTGKAIAGAVMVGLPGNPISDDNGNFVDSVSKGWSGNITPLLNGYTFNPVNRTYSNVTANTLSQDFIGNFSSVRTISVNPTSFTINQTSVSTANSPSHSFLDNTSNSRLNSTIQDLSKITNHPIGCLIPDSIVEYWKNHTSAPVLNLKSISTIIDWSNNDSPVKDQGQCGACWAFASAAYIENLGSQTNLSEQALLSCAGAGGCEGGYYEQAMQFIQSKGIPDETCYPYAQVNGICGNMCSNSAFKEKIKTVSNSLWGIATVDQLKAQLQNGPLIVTMRVPTDGSFDGGFGYQRGIYHYSGGPITSAQGHAVLLVGYDESQKCFKVKNSWGNWWGENGYFRISYDDVTNEVEFGSYAINGSGTYTENLSNASFTITNQGNDNLTISSILSSKEWLTVSGENLIVSPLAVQNVSVAINWSKLNSGTETGTITIQSNDPEKPTMLIKVTAIPSCAGIVTASITQEGSATICEGDFTILNAGTGDDLIYQWKKNGSDIPDANGTSYIATTGGGYSVEVSHVSSGCSSVSTAVALIVNPTPPPPTIALNGNTLKSNHTTGNQWYNKDGLIAGATNQSFSPAASGDYYNVTTINGCNSNPSNSISYIPTGINYPTFNQPIKVYPNPVSDELTIEIEGNNSTVTYEIMNSIGQVIFKGKLIDKTYVHTNSYATGVYLIKFKNGKTFEFRKFVKE